MTDDDILECYFQYSNQGRTPLEVIRKCCQRFYHIGFTDGQNSVIKQGDYLIDPGRTLTLVR